MRKLKLLLGLLALIVGGSNAWAADAYATYLTTERGWTKVTNLSSMTLSDYYFAIVSNDNTDLMVALGQGVHNEGNHALFYKNAKDPVKDNTFLWIIENNTTEGYAGYTFRNVDFSKRVLQTHENQSYLCRTNWEQSPVRWSSYACTLNNGAYTIQTLANGGSDYLGLWTYENGYKNGEELAGNKKDSQIGKFLFYAIPRTTAASLAIAAEGATLSSPYELGYFMFGRTNSDYEGATGIYEPGGWENESNKVPESYKDNVAPSTGDKITKTITNAPNGYHKITVIANAAWISGRGVVGTTAPDTHDNSTVVTINGVSQNVPVRTDGNYNPVTLTFHTYVKDNNISFKITNNDPAAFWFVWEVKDLYYGEAGEFTNGGTLSANQWYYYDAVGGNFTATAGSDLGKISFITQSGSSTPSTLTSPTSLSATRYYFMSSVQQTLTLTNTDSAPFADGDYYLKVYNQDLYLSRSGNWGAEAATDIYGVAFTATRQTDGKYTLKSADVTAALNSSRYINYGGATGGSYTDSETLTNWIFKASTNGYYLKPNDSYYINTATYGALDRPYNYLTATTTEGEAIEWQLLDASTYTANLASRLNAQATAVAAAAELSSTTVSALETEITSWVQKDYSSYINNPSLTASTTGWDVLTYAHWGHNAAGCDGNACEIYDRVGGLKQTVSGLPEGLYKVTVDACYRLGSEDNSKAAKNKIDVTAFFSANTVTQTNVSQIKSWYDYAGSRPTDRSTFASVKSNYTNTLYVYVKEGQDLTLTIGTFGGIYQTWTPFMNWTLTRYGAAPTAEEKAALASAISTAETKTLGLEEGEYAPYNNVAAIEKLAEAKAVNVETAMGVEVVTATSALTGTSWTENDSEMNAFYNPSFALSDNDGAMIGWKNSNAAGLGGATHSRAFVLTSGQTNYDKLGVFNQGEGTRSVAYFRFDSYNSGRDAVYTYGETEGYTIPLKAVSYRLKAKFGSWNQPNKNVKLAVVAEDGTEIGSQTVTTIGTLHDGTGSVTKFDFLFTPVSEGNYKIQLSNPENVDNAIVITAFELKKAVADDVTISEAATSAPTATPLANVTLTRSLAKDNWNTFSVPFNLSAAQIAASALNGATIKKVKSIDDNVITMEDATEIVAGKPYLVKPTVAIVNPVFNSVAVIGTGGETEGEGDYKFVGQVYNKSLATDGSVAYLATDGKIKKLTSGSIKGLRAYFIVPIGSDSAPARISFFGEDDSTTGIVEMQNDTTAVNNKVYDLNGRCVESIKKGIYVINGKKIIKK